MSDVMLFGVLRMPYEMAMSDELSRYQFWQRAQEAANRIEADESTLHAAQQRAEAAEAECKLLRVKTTNSLANNLCPDHRDKQAGEPCLACTIETMTRKLAAAEAERDALKADALRYRWLRDDSRGRSLSVSALSWTGDPTDADRAVDNAIAQEPTP